MASVEEAEVMVREAIDWIRSAGIGEFVPLPSVIVCGDQSTGKSSLLERLFGMKFPTHELLCTRYPIELALQKGHPPKSASTIRPGYTVGRPSVEVDHLKKFVSHSSPYTQLGEIVNAANEWMRIDGKNVCFSRDVLQVKATDPHAPDTTMVDLPGLFRTDATGQREQDVASVEKLIQSYMDAPRTIILVILSGKAEPAMQLVTSFARNADPNGERTIGILTKPDLISGKLTREMYVNRILNQPNSDAFLTHGWYVVKNGGEEEEAADANARVRNENEDKFLSQGQWAAVPKHLKGITSLREKIDAVAHQQIFGTIPAILKDLQRNIERETEHLSKLESIVPTGTAQDFCTKIHSAVSDALVGHYDKAFFFCDDAQSTKQRKLRNCIQEVLTEFRTSMYSNGHMYDADDKAAMAIVTDREATNDGELRSRSAVMDYLCCQLRAWGNSGDFPHKLAMILFRKKAKKWPSRVKRLSLDVQKRVEDFLRQHLLPAFCPSPHTRSAITNLLLDPAMPRLRAGLDVHVEHLVALWDNSDAGPINFDDNITQCRHSEFTAELRRVLDEIAPHPNTAVGQSMDLSSLRSALEQVDLVRMTAAGVARSVELYYRVRPMLSIPLKLC